MSMVGGQRICDDCKATGVINAAHFVVRGVDKCKVHFEKREALVQENNNQVTEQKEEEKATMSKKIDWVAVQNDRSCGVPVSELVKRYKVSNVTIYAHTKGSDKPRLVKSLTKAIDTRDKVPTKRRKMKKARKFLQQESVGKASRFTAVLVELRNEIAKLQHEVEVIEALE